jgi:hypothetical protein
LIGDHTAPDPIADPSVGPDEQRIDDDTVGVSLVVPAHLRVERDPVLFDTHGFFLQSVEGTHHHALARIALAYGSTPDQIEPLVADKLARYPGARREEVTLPDGRAAVAVTDLPGTEPYTALFVRDAERVYEIGLWSEQPGVDPQRLALLDRIEFRAPTIAIESHGLARSDAALFGEPPAEEAERSEVALQQRRQGVARVAAADPEFRAARTGELTAAVPRTNDGASCGFTAPASLYWQLQWDGSNTFYSGTYYDLREIPGWSAMSGNYGSWWGTNYHVGLCYSGYSNQYYANDWPAQHWANAYAAFSGYVEWAGWGTDGFATLGRYVVVRNGQYRSTTAHLVAIRAGVTWGAWIDGYWDLIGWAGDTGGPWDPHLHARVTWGESLTWNGQPYGGESVRPNGLRCFECGNYDVAAAGGGGWYTNFFHGRWMYY